jgi:outer membrane protein, multidrug efflux system
MKTNSLHGPLKILGIGVIAFLSACTAGPTYQPPNPDMPSRWSETPVNVSAQADTKISTWWTLFGDPVLDSLVIRAMASNQDLRMAESRVREARAVRRMTASKSFPSVDATGSYTYSRTGDTPSSFTTTQDLFQLQANQDLYQAGFDVSWEIDIFGGTRRATEAADASVAASVEDSRDVLVSLVAEVSRNYLELRGIQQRLVLAKENISIQEKTFEVARKRFQSGFGDELAVVQAETQHAMARSQIPPLESAASQAMHQLALLLGRMPEALVPELTGKKPIPAIPPQVPVTLPSELLRQRPDIRRAERQLAAATAEIGVATAELFPRFSLAAFIGLESTDLSSLVTRGSRFWSVGPQVKWSLFDGGKIHAGIDASNSRRDRAQILYEKTVLTALTETENALVAFSREQQTRQSLKTAVIAGQRALSISKTKYELGFVDLLNVLQTELAYYQAQDQLAQSEQRLSLDMVALFKALGGGWEISKEEAQTLLSEH